MSRYDVESILSSDLPVVGGATGRAAKFPLDSLQPGSAAAMMLAGAAAASQATMPPSEKDYWSLPALHYQQQQERQFPASAYEAYGSGGVNVDFTMGTSSGSYLKSGGRPRKKLSLRDGINFVLLISRQGKVRLTKWYSPYTQKERTKVIRELSGLILTRGPKLCNFVEWRGYKVVYRRYASLYFCMCIDAEDNELEVLEIIHHFVEILDRYFGSVCELDLIFNFHKAYYILDEILIAGELQESSKKNVARLIAAQDSLVEAAKEEASSISNIIAQATK
ncbi:AP-1 complex subunit sigma-2 [Zea mays]|uniref:Adaptor AP-1 19 kDa protein n=1 Tax=Zea mays TaxID=4577 RepID=A0A1D6L6Q0_MAIZE|nr:AP-1 complex subunit sigma-2 [Zea mays]